MSEPETVECPSCGEPLVPSATSCPVCLRTRSAREITRGIRDLRPSAKFKRVVTHGGLWRVLFGLAVLGGVYFAHSRGLLPTGKAGKRARRILSGKAAAERPPELVNSNPEAAAAAKADARVQAERAAARERAKAAAVKEAPETAPTEAQERRWRIRGRIYDLLTLKPVAGARISFSGPDGPVRARSSADGAYAVDLPPLADGGYAVTVRAEGYDGRYLEEMRPPYHTQGRARREQDLELLRSGAVLHVPLSLAEDEDGRRHDLILAR